jgi:hypothetical protein
MFDVDSIFYSSLLDFLHFLFLVNDPFSRIGNILFYFRHFSLKETFILKALLLCENLKKLNSFSVKMKSSCFWKKMNETIQLQFFLQIIRDQMTFLAAKI